MARAVARACSVLQFHATSTCVAICRGGEAVDSSIGRPLSNRPDSMALLCRTVELPSDLLITITSQTRPYLPTKLSPAGASSNHPNDSDPALHLERGTSCVCMKDSNISRDCSASSGMSCL